ncbi:sterile alpha motif domain-containing protein 12-like [Sardina pilchardus]|uniref:sterile alpha motif domain-containing protein 12-like n=1 Tax=Sardina pilchardus TaxID=27697 RepID=UPI002E0E0258
MWLDDRRETILKSTDEKPDRGQSNALTTECAQMSRNAGVAFKKRSGQVTSQKFHMGSSKRVSYWTVEEVYHWVKKQYLGEQSALQQAVLIHAISGRALLRMSEHQLDRLGIEPESQPEILQDLLLLRVQEELENLNDIFSECFSS